MAQLKFSGRDGVPLRLPDVVICAMGVMGALFLLTAARWAPGATRSLWVFAIVAGGAPLLRALPRLLPRWARLFDFAASFWLLPAAIYAHAHLGPIADEVQPVLMDRHLAAADLALFGRDASVFLDGWSPPWLTEVLFVCYYSYFLWPVALGVLLYFKGRRRAYNEFVLALSLYFTASFVLYVLVPAVGPRFFLADLYPGPLRGMWLTPFLESLMRAPRFMRDCFPSGHTAVTLLVMAFAYRYQRRFFWGFLPPGLGLIAGTMVCRFHYVIDVIFALPMAAGVLLLTGLLTRARPRGVLVLPLPLSALRKAARA